MATLALTACALGALTPSRVVAQAAQDDRPTVGVLAFYIDSSGQPEIDRPLRAAADRIHEALIIGLQQDSAVRWSESHEDLPTPIDGVHNLARLKVEYLVTGRITETPSGRFCTLRVFAIESGEVARVTTSFHEGGETGAAVELVRGVVAAVVDPRR